MIRLSILYPAGDDITFDLDYYKNNHRDLCMRVLGCERMEVDTAIAGPYVAAGHLYYSSMEAFQAGTGGPDAGQAADDVKNYTNATPVMQIAEIVE